LPDDAKMPPLSQFGRWGFAKGGKLTKCGLLFGASG
jgi:hypothetical protein